ncbi:MAG: ABC transporter permease [Saprospiraceae bacterium]
MSQFTSVIEPKLNPFKINFKEIWQYKELLWTLAYRDLRVKYAQTAIGFTWAIINPLFTIVILSFVFGSVAKVDTGTTPHIIYTAAGMCGWTYFSALLGQAGNSIIGAQNMVKKIYFPRLIIPMSKAITAFVDLAIVLACIAILMIIYQTPITSSIIYLPLFLGMAVISGLSAGIWMSALTIRYRDFTHITPMLLRIGLYLTPIAYPASAVPEKYQVFFYMNPMAGVVEGVRWSLIGGEVPNNLIYISFVIVTLLFIAGLFYFNKTEKVMADIL